MTALEDARTALGEEWPGADAIQTHAMSALDSMRRKDSALRALLKEVERLRGERDSFRRQAAHFADRGNVAEAKLAALEAQPDWEYGAQSEYSDAVWLVDRDNTAIWDDIPSDRRVRRHEAGPWEPVPDTRSNT